MIASTKVTMKTLKSPHLPWLMITPYLFLVSVWGCNDHPVLPLDQVLNASNRVENRLPAKTKLDFLFVIDNSSSMGEEVSKSTG